MIHGGQSVVSESKSPRRSLLVLLGCPLDKDTITPLPSLVWVPEGDDAVRIGLARADCRREIMKLCRAWK